MALQVARRGLDLLLVARREERLKALAGEIASLGRKADILVADLGAPQERRKLLDAMTAQAGRLSLVVNNAGFGHVGPTAALSFDRTRQMLELNITALTELTYAAAKIFAAQSSGGIINVSSTAAFQPVPFMNVYSASKSYVLSFTYALAEELKGSGIRVMTLCPGYTDTEFHEVAGAKLENVRTRYAMDPARCVSIALRDFDNGKRISVTGGLNKAQVFASWLLPRNLVARFTAEFMKRASQR
jgi:short-subunit dehydrogenase